MLIEILNQTTGETRIHDVDEQVGILIAQLQVDNQYLEAELDLLEDRLYHPLFIEDQDGRKEYRSLS